MQMRQVLRNYEDVTEELMSIALHNAVSQVKRRLSRFTYYFPRTYSNKKFYGQTENTGWTTGFWTGQVWLAYEHTNDNYLKSIGNMQVDSFIRRLQKAEAVDVNEIGMLLSPSCVAAHQLEGSDLGKAAVILAADYLMENFDEKLNIFRSYKKNHPSEYIFLAIESLFSMPLLFRASEYTGEPQYRDKARLHIDMVMKLLFKQGGKVCCTSSIDEETGTWQPCDLHRSSDKDTVWARGQAWGIYGMALCYSYLKDRKYLVAFQELVKYYVENIPKDLIPYWDLSFGDGSGQPKDSSAAAIAICGILEVARCLPLRERERYRKLAFKLMEALVKRCAVEHEKISNGLLLHGTYMKSSGENYCTNLGVDECCVWGDYFYLEGLMRLHKEWAPYW